MKSILFVIFLTSSVYAWSQVAGNRPIGESIRTMRVQSTYLKSTTNSALNDIQVNDKAGLELFRRKREDEMPTTGNGGSGTGSGGSTGGGIGGTGSGKTSPKTP